MGQIFIVMGVSATGKSTVGKALADRTGGEFFDGDHFHPPENVRKMSSGQPLNDDDRRGWLQALAELAHKQSTKPTPTFIACSALKQKYRDVLAGPFSPNHGPVFLFLTADPEMLRQRIKARYDNGQHFMPPSMLQSQLDTLEEPQDAFRLDVKNPPEQIVTQVLERYFPS